MLGRSNPRMRRVRALRRDAALRRSEGIFLAEGTRLAREALASDAAIEEAVISPRLEKDEEGRELIRRLDERGVPCVGTSDEVLAGLQDARSPQPILLLVRRPAWQPKTTLAPSERGPLVVVAHAVQDPGNLGSLLRTADAAGAACLFTTGSGVDPFHPRAVRASMGSIYRLPLFETDLEALLVELAARQIRTVGADPRGESDYRDGVLGGTLALFFGREAQGLPSELARRLDRRVRIPMRAGVESLSIGAAAAVLLFEAARAREAALAPGRKRPAQ